VTLAREGADVVLFDVAAPIDGVPYELAGPDDLQETASAVEALGRQALVVQGDVRRREDLDRAVSAGLERFGRIDTAIAKAGIWVIDRFWEMTPERWQTVLDINLTGVFNTAQAVVGHMMERRQGSMILIASVNGLEASGRCAHYGAAKAGVINLAKTLAVELGPYNVRANAIAPGLIDTVMNSWQGALDYMAGREGGTQEDRLAAAPHWGSLPESLVPPSSVSNAVLYLASDEAVHVTGTTVVIDAGHYALPGFNTEPGEAPAVSP
jgi:NAD(P)-dependent dehydrogenase (short-subunit alcohol dehydrogenase family)